MSNLAITISREYASGGRAIAGLLAKDLDINYYDKEIIQMVSEKSGLAAGFIEKSEEKISNPFLHNFQYSAFSGFDSIAYYDTPVPDKVYLAQSAVIRDIALRSDCIIVGRCADYILRNEPGLLRVFIRAEMDDRIKRAVDSYGLSNQKIEENIKKIDKSRANYYRFYTSLRWGDIANYDLVINTSFTGIDGAVEIIRTLVKTNELLK